MERYLLMVHVLDRAAYSHGEASNQKQDGQLFEFLGHLLPSLPIFTLVNFYFTTVRSTPS